MKTKIVRGGSGRNGMKHEREREREIGGGEEKMNEDEKLERR